MAKPEEHGNDDETQLGGDLDSADVPNQSNVDTGPSLETKSPTLRSSSSSIGHTIENYRLLEPLGEGGMGTVYLAEQKKPVRRRVAIKIIKEGLDSDHVIARFEAERQALAIMDHASIAKVLDAGATKDGRPYFVMELVQGSKITKYCDERKMGIPERLELFIKVCDAVQHAHQKGIIHRDLKPSNILVKIQDDQPLPKVIDFGLAKATQQQLTDKTLFTSHDQVLGTLEYMSPEQSRINNQDIDTRTDIYSLGVVLYELLAGSTPLKRESLRNADFVQILARIQEEDAVKPSSRISDSTDNLDNISSRRGLPAHRLADLVRGDLDWIVLKTLEKDRARRYESMSSLAADIKRYLADEPILARPPTISYQLSKLYRRQKYAVLGSLSAVLLIGISMAMVVYFSISAANEARQKQEIADQLLATDLDGKLQLAIKTGDWQFAEQYCRRLLESDLDSFDRRATQFRRFECLSSLGRFADLKKAVMQFEQENKAKDAELLLWQGEMKLIEGDYWASKPIFQEALNTGTLDSENEFYVRSLLSKTMHDSLKFAIRGLEIAPYHYRLNIQLFWIYFLDGNFEASEAQLLNARTRFPDDPIWKIFIAFQDAAKGNTDLADASLKETLDNIDVQEIVESLENSLRLFSFWSDTMESWEQGSFEVTYLKNLELIRRWKNSFRQSGSASLDGNRDNIWRGTTLVRLPYAYFKEFDLMTEFLKLSREKKLERAKEILETHSGNSLHAESWFYIAMVLDTNGEKELALKTYELAGNASSPIANVNRESWLVACMTAAQIYLASGRTDKEMINRAAKNAHEFSAVPGTTSPLHHYDFMARVALESKEVDLARELLDRYEVAADEPNDVLEIRYALVAEQYFQCIVKARMYLTENPGNDVVQGYLDQAIEALETRLEQEPVAEPSSN